MALYKVTSCLSKLRCAIVAKVSIQMIGTSQIIVRASRSQYNGSNYCPDPVYKAVRLRASSATHLPHRPEIDVFQSKYQTELAQCNGPSLKLIFPGKLLFCASREQVPQCDGHISLKFIFSNQSIVLSVPRAVEGTELELHFGGFSSQHKGLSGG